MWKFLRQVLASILGTLIALGAVTFIGAGLIGVLIVASFLEEDEEVTVRDRSVLVVDLSIPVFDSQPIETVAEAIVEESSYLNLRQTVRALEAAAADDRIVALFLDGRNGGSGSGYAILAELQPAIAAFKAAEKPIIAYDVDLTEREYYLSSLADDIVLDPMGTMELDGLSAEQVFFAQALDRFGIGVQVIRAGAYKAAVEPFIQEQFSPENREQLDSLLRDLWQDFLATIATNRQQTPNKLQLLANTKGVLTPQEAERAELIDRVAYFDEVVTQLRELTEEGEDALESSFRQIDLSAYYTLEVANNGDSSSENKVAILYATGEIVYGEGEIEQIGSDRMRDQLRDLREDEDVKAVVFRIDSPGGSATASELILREIQLLREQKPVVVSMGNVAASGGYWIATSSDQIFAQANTITGSIGVFGLLPNIADLGNENGFTWDVVKTGVFADADTLSRPKTPTELARYQLFVDNIYDLFLEKVADSRELSRDRVAEIAQGRVWSGMSAKNIGLVDQIGGLDAAIAYAAEIAELGDDWAVEEYQNEPSFEEILLRTFAIENQPAIAQQWHSFDQALQLFQLLSDPQETYALWPLQLRID